MGNTKWTYHKEWAFATDYIISLKILFEYKNLSEIVDSMYRYQCSNYPNIHSHTFRERVTFI